MITKLHGSNTRYRARDFSVLQKVRIGSETFPISYSMSTMSLSVRVKQAEITNGWFHTSIPQYVFVAWTGTTFTVSKGENQLDATNSDLLVVSCSSTCFGRLYAHHQEVGPRFAACGFCPVVPIVMLESRVARCVHFPFTSFINHPSVLCYVILSL